MKIQEHTIAKTYLQACDFVLNTGQGLADHTACYLLGDQHILTRYANNQIIQNVRKQDHTMVVKVILSGRIGMASCNQLDEQTLYRTVKQAIELAKYAPINSMAYGFPEPEIIPQVNGCDEATEQVSAAEMAEIVRTITSKAVDSNLRAAGAVQVQIVDQAVANSAGVRVYGRRTKAELHAVVLGASGGSGFATDAKRSFYDLQAEEVARIAIEKCKLSERAIDLPAGDYPVILEQKATADLLSYLGVLGFNPTSYHQGDGFLSNRMGYRVLSEQISISEDPLGKEGLPVGFDWDGLPKQKVSLIQDGVATGMVYDDVTGKKYGSKSTGNAGFPIERSRNVYPSHLHMEAGKTSRDDMIAQLDRGILITRFHYLGVLHPKETLITGMTRGGTFLVENGKIVAPVKNLRFTEKISNALNQVIAVGNESKLHSWTSSMNTVKAPDLMLSTFHFNGTASH